MIEAIQDLAGIRDALDMGQIRNPRIYRARENPFQKYTDREFKNRYRFTKAQVENLYGLLGNEFLIENDRGNPVDGKLQLMCALRYFARGQIQDDTADLHGLSQPTISRIIKKVRRYCFNVIFWRK
jgi:hypothetical protein